MELLAKCPNKSHEDWKYAVEKLGEEKTWYLYDKLGQELPTKKQVDCIRLVPKETTPAKVSEDNRLYRPEDVIVKINEAKSVDDIHKLILGYKRIINSKLHNGKVYVTKEDLGYANKFRNRDLAQEMVDKVNEVYPGLLFMKREITEGKEAGRPVYTITVNDHAWRKFVERNDDKNFQQGMLFKKSIQKMSADLKAQESEELKSIFSNNRDITDPYEYMNSLKDQMSTMLKSHKDLMEFMNNVRHLNPNMKIRQINVNETGRYNLDKEVSDKALAVWSPKDKTIYLFKDRIAKEPKAVLSGILLHEMIHGFTNNVIWRYKQSLLMDYTKTPEGMTPEDYDRAVYGEPLSQKEFDFVHTINELFVKAKNLTKDRGHYGWTDLTEFVAEGLSDQRLIDELKSMHDPKDRSTEKLSLWQKFKGAILRLFGMDDTPNSYHEQLLSSITDYVYNVRRPNTGAENIISAKLSDALHVDPNNPVHTQFKDLLQQVNDQYDDKIKTGEDKFDSITGVMDKNRFGDLPYSMWDEDKKQEMQKYADVGNTTHFHVEKNFSSAVDTIKDAYKLTPQAESDLRRIFAPLQKEGASVFSEVVLPDMENKVLGRADIIVIDKNNKIHIFDVKTKTGGFSHFDVTRYPKQGEPSFLPYSDYDKAGIQLTGYKNIIQKITEKLDLEVETMNVIPLKPKVNFETKVIEGYELDKSFNGKDVIPVHDRREAAFLYENTMKTMEPKDHQDTLTDEEEHELSGSIQDRLKVLTKNTEETQSPEQKIVLKSILALERKMAISGKRDKGATRYKEQLKTINEILNEPSTQDQLVHIVQVASGICNSAKKALDDARLTAKQIGKDITLSDLYKFKEAVSSFDILDQYRSLLDDKYGIDITPEMRKAHPEATRKLGSLKSKLETAIRNKDSVKFAYENEGLRLLAEALLPYYGKVKAERRRKYGQEYRDAKFAKTLTDPGMTEDEYVRTKLNENGENIEEETQFAILKELKKAGQDIGTLTRWADNVLDSPDAVVGALIKAFVSKDDQARIEIEHKRLEMLPIVNEFREFTKQYGHNYQKAYEFMLEKGLRDDKLTGNITTKWHSSLIRLMRNTQAAADFVFEDDIKRARFMKNWKDQYMPEVTEAKNKAFIEYLDELNAKGEITTYEWDRFKANVQIAPYPKVAAVIQAEEGSISDNCVDLVSQWYMENGMTFREPAPEWVNPQYTKLKKMLDEHPDDPRSKMYKMITEIGEMADDIVPTSVKRGTQLPGVVKDQYERVGSGQNLADMAKGAFSRVLNFKVDDTHRVNTDIVDSHGDARYFVPVHFTGRVTKTMKDAEGNEWKEFDPSEQSFDLANIYYNYFMSAVDFQWKNDILPEMEMARYLFNQREIVKRDSKGAIKYITSKFLPKGESVTEQVGIGGNIAKQYDTWLLYALYGQGQKNLGVIPGTNIDAGKLVGGLQRFTALNLLALNYTAGIASAALTESSMAIEAFANREIGGHEWVTAQGTFMKNLPGMLGDVGSLKPDNLVSLLLREFNVIHGGKKHNLTQSRWIDMVNSNAMFQVATFGWTSMQTKLMLALLEKKRAYDKDGKDIGSMLSLYKVKDGKLDIDKSTGFDEEKSEWDTEHRMMYLHKMRGYIAKIHGDQSDLGRVALQQNALTAMAYMFRRFIIPTFKRRWGGEHFNTRSDNFEEGMYVSTAKFARQLLRNMNQSKEFMLSKEWATADSMVKSNVIRTFGDIITICSAIILANVAISMAKNAKQKKDEEWQMKMWNFMAYQALRLKAEYLFYTSPKAMMQILRSPAASLSTFENTIKLFEQLCGPGWQEYQQGPWKGQMKIKKTLIDMSIGVKQYYRLRDMGQQVGMMQAGIVKTQ
jgi:hypothetical protein